MKTIPEILAPVGSEEALIAAVRSGADAVYFGTDECNARRNAGKFEGEALDRAVRYCHARGVLVYLTVNTLVRDEEIDTAARTLEHIAHSGADAIIVQDLAIASLAKAICPSLALHASTQMAVHNAAGVRMLERMGFSRVVLARELTGEEIRRIRRTTDAELEVFVHGALCMSASGMCYLSASLGERSGNRGTCAQPCRLPFACNGEQNCLSLKDMSHLRYVRELAEIGIASCKIEGRMKRPEYVAAAVDAARRSRDDEPYETGGLRAVFSRSGFTDGYYTGKRDRNMFGVRTKEDVDRSKEVLASFRELYRSERARVPVSARMAVRAEQPIRLDVSDGTHTVSAEGQVPEPSQKIALTSETLQRNIEKTGGTPFRLDAFSCEIDPGLYVPASCLNALRKEALDRLSELRETPQKREVFSWTPPKTENRRRTGAPQYVVRFARAEQTFSDERIAYRSFPVSELSAHPELITPQTFCELPELCYPMDEDRLKDALLQLRTQGVTDAIAGNIGGIELARAVGMRVHGGYGLNVTNALAAKAYADLGLCSLTASFELPYPKIRDLKSSVPLGCLVAGHLPLMQLRACPARGKDGCGGCDGHPIVTDRMGRSFPIVCHARKYSTMLNGVLYYAADKKLPDADFYTLYLTVESKAEAQALFEHVVSREKPASERTTGMSFRTLL